MLPVPAGAATATYRRRTPEAEPLYQVLAGHLETFLALQRGADQPLPGYVEQELRAYLPCDLLAYGFLRALRRLRREPRRRLILRGPLAAGAGHGAKAFPVPLDGPAALRTNHAAAPLAYRGPPPSGTPGP